jgi:hypothetical protein
MCGLHLSKGCARLLFPDTHLLDSMIISTTHLKLSAYFSNSSPQDLYQLPNFFSLPAWRKK